MKKKAVRIPVSESISLTEINEAPYNPRTISPEQMTALRASLRKHGLVLNLVVQRKGMILIGGHQRLRALRQICEEDGTEIPQTIPCVVLDVTDAEAKQLNVALNKIDGEFDPYKLGEVFASMREVMTLEDITATGFTSDEFNEAVQLFKPLDEVIHEIRDDDSGVGAFAKSVTLTIEFASVKQRDDAKELLRELVTRNNAKAGKIVLQALKAHALASPPSSAQEPARPKRGKRAA